MHGHAYGADDLVPPPDGKFYYEFYFDEDEQLIFTVAHPPDGERYVTGHLLYKRGEPFARLTYGKQGLSFGDYVYYHRARPFLSCRILNDGRAVLVERLNGKPDSSQQDPGGDVQKAAPQD